MTWRLHFRLRVLPHSNEWLAEDAQACQVSAYTDSPAILKAPLSQMISWMGIAAIAR